MSDQAQKWLGRGLPVHLPRFSSVFIPFNVVQCDIKQPQTLKREYFTARCSRGQRSISAKLERNNQPSSGLTARLTLNFFFISFSFFSLSLCSFFSFSKRCFSLFFCSLCSAVWGLWRSLLKVKFNVQSQKGCQVQMRRRCMKMWLQAGN